MLFVLPEWAALLLLWLGLSVLLSLGVARWFRSLR